MIKYLKHGKEKIPVKIGFYALKHFQNETKKSDIDNMTFEEVEILFYHSYVGAVKSLKDEGYTVKYEREQMEEILEDNFKEFINLIPEFFADKKK